jgi:spore germination protein GerM
MLKKTLWIVVALLLLALVVWLLRERSGEPLPPEEMAETEQVRDVTLYFGSADARSLVPESRQIRSSDRLLENLRGVIEALVSGPSGDGVATIPSSVRLLGVYVNDKTAYLDFSQELAEDFSGGTAAEYMLVASVVQTVCANFTEVTAVQLLIEGQETDTIGGHLNVANPLKPEDWR